LELWKYATIIACLPIFLIPIPIIIVIIYFPNSLEAVIGALTALFLSEGGYIWKIRLLVYQWVRKGYYSTYGKNFFKKINEYTDKSDIFPFSKVSVNIIGKSDTECFPEAGKKLTMYLRETNCEELMTKISLKISSYYSKIIREKKFLSTEAYIALHYSIAKFISDDPEIEDLIKKQIPKRGSTIKSWIDKWDKILFSQKYYGTNKPKNLFFDFVGPKLENIALDNIKTRQNAIAESEFIIENTCVEKLPVYFVMSEWRQYWKLTEEQKIQERDKIKNTVKEKLDKTGLIVLSARGDNRKIMEKVVYWLIKENDWIDYINADWKNEVGFWRFKDGTEKAIEWVLLKKVQKRTKRT
jgi:hypothetical protein